MDKDKLLTEPKFNIITIAGNKASRIVFLNLLCFKYQ